MSIPDLSFLWPASHLATAPAALLSATGCGAILDCRAGDAAALCLTRPGAAPDVLVSCEQILEPSTGRSLADAGVRNAWVECSPLADPDRYGRLADDLAARSDALNLVPVVCDLALLDHLLATHDWPAIALKGHEASGFVCGETAHVLLSIAERARRKAGRNTRLVVWGGIATAEAAAAFLSTGAAGIVFESVHWLTSEMGLDAALRHSLQAMRADFTRVAGVELGIHCRLFDKGNSRAVRALLALRLESAHAPLRDARNVFLQRIAQAWTSPLSGGLGPDQLVPLGPEAAFAAAFVERFGSDSRVALPAFRARVLELCASSAARLADFARGPVAREWGTRYPIVQGAMSWITDQPDFARQVAEAGGLPTIALGMRGRTDLERDFGRLVQALEARPYAVNVIVLAENPARDEQLAWIEATRPPFVVIAAGDPSFARRLIEKGLRVLYVASDEGLLRVALEAGVRTVIVEGNEAGGHVGPHSLTTVAQTLHELKRRQPALVDGVRVVLAGGIFDGASAHRAVMLGADAVQLGTAYLATEEIVATGALSRLYQEQICAAQPGGTMVLGEAVGLRIRALRSPKTEAIARIERQAGVPEMSERDVRKGLEEQATGTLLVAARGVRSPGGPPLDERVCREEGQFMSGAVAGCIDAVTTLAALHDAIMSGAGAPVERHAPIADIAAPAVHATRTGAGTATRPRERVAITGMAIANALGHTPDDIWEGVAAGRSGIVTVPDCKWDHASIYDPRPGTLGKTYCNVAAFLDLAIDRKDIGIPPQDFRTMALSTRLTMWLAGHALADAQLVGSDIPRERIAVLVAQNSGEAASTLADLTITMAAPLLARTVAQTLGLTPADTARVEAALCAGRISVDDTTLLGRLNCTAAGFLCNQYGFMGPGYAVTAACATSLVALYNAVHLIREGVIDAALVGGGEEALFPAHFIEFAAVGALAGTSGRARPACEASRPFDIERDGMVLGEGGAMLVVERESVARRRGARIHAFVAGVGASNNTHGMVESAAATQTIAINAAYADAGFSPDSVDLVECHATSTAQGDAEEVRALKTVFPAGRGTALASFKSQIGHTLGASGLMSLIRGVLAIEHGTRPPSLNYVTPDPAVDLESWGFEVPREARDWAEPARHPRRFEVNAFGFGGSNYVALVEENAEDRGVVFVAAEDDGRMVLPADVSRHDLHGVLLLRAETPEATLRAAVADPDRPAREQAIDRLRRRDARAGEGLFVIARQGLYAADEAAPVPPLAFMFPGQGSQYVGMGRELARAFPVVRQAFEQMAAVADFDLLGLLFEGGEDMLRNTRWQQPALFALQYGLAEFFRSCGVVPAAVAGHSLGETTALAMAGVISWEDGFRLVNKRGECMDRLSTSGLDAGAMLATDIPLERLQQKLAARPSVVISNDNSPRQIVLGGDTGEIADLQRELEAEGCWVRRLRVSMAFHTPRSSVLQPEIDPFLETIEIRAPRLPILANSTDRPYPDDPAAIRAIISAHLVTQVHWRQNVQRLADEYGIRVFVELGPKDVLSSLVSDTVPSALTIPTALPNTELATCRAALARLAALGHVHTEVAPLRIVVGHDRGGAATAAHEAAAGESRPSAGDRGSAEADTPFLEDVIHLIMEATGYERHEIEPDMDIRQDLSIRSSRLPVIIDGAERRFGLRIYLEELIDVRTVRDLAAALARMAERGGVAPGPRSAEPLADTVSRPVARPEGRGPRRGTRAGVPEASVSRRVVPLHRLTWTESRVEARTPSPVAIGKGARVAVVSWNGPSPIAGDLAKWFSKRYGARTQEVILHAASLLSLDAEALANDVDQLVAAHGSVAGLVFTVDGLRAVAEGDETAIERALTATFAALKTFLRSDDREFCLAIDRTPSPGDPVSEGILGLFLTAAQEYASVLFRHVRVDAATPLSNILDRSLDTDLALVPLRFRGDDMLTIEARPEPLRAGEPRHCTFAKGDVVLVTGGGRGITPHLAAALAPFGPTLVLLGRTDHVAAVDDGKAEASPDELSLDGRRGKASPDDEIAGTLATLAAAGVAAEYWRCDVSRADEVAAVVDRAVQRFGRIDGIVHGAGILRDGLMAYMTAADFAAVAAVKVTGLARLCAGARPHGLRVVVALSSLAAVTGNAGQANYTAANRAMAALIGSWCAQSEGDGLRGQTLWLPPVEGVGMASGAEIRELLELRGLEDAFVTPDEVAMLFAHELFLAPSSHSDAIFARVHPPVRTTRMLVPAAEGHLATPLVVERDDFPLVDRIETLDAARGLLVARRTFTAERDLWLADHRPLKQLPDPIVSAVLLVETALEATRLLYPHLDVIEVRDVDFLEMLPCPAGQSLVVDIVARRVPSDRAVLCEVSVSHVEDPGQPPRQTPGLRSFGCRVLVGAAPALSSAGEAWLAREACTTEPLDRAAILRRYEAQTALAGRYLVHHGCEGTTADRIAGYTLYPEQQDFAGGSDTRYQYSPYVLEALLQIAHFHHRLRDDRDERQALPMHIGRLSIGRPVLPGERIRVEGRRTGTHDGGTLWDVRAIDSSGAIVMEARGVLAGWFTG